MTIREPQNPSPDKSRTQPEMGRQRSRSALPLWRVRLWCLRGLSLSAEEPVAVGFTRAVVSEAAPPAPNEASAALGHCYRCCGC